MSTISIKYNNTDITNSVLFASARFEAQLGAFPGTFEFIVRDDEQLLSFSTGKEVTLDIDGVRYYGGFTTQVSQQLAIPVDDTTVISSIQTRQWVLRGADYNLLLDKRVVFNKAAPTQAIPIQSLPFTDQQAVSKLCNEYLDLSGDGIDFSTYVDVVGPVVSTGTEFGYQGSGASWRKQMESISNQTGAIWYIDSSKKLHYQKVESLTPPWGFADKPNNTTTYGFREMQFIEDATRVANDALVWGGSEFGSSGLSSQTVFAQVENLTSQGVTGRWQYAEQHFNEPTYFEQGGVNNRGNIIVFGEPGTVIFTTGPDENRGLQNPQLNIRLAWFSGGTPTPLAPGAVVNIFLYSFGPPPLQLSLPARSITISFPTPSDARLDAFFGIQTSDPWTLWKYVKKVAESRTERRTVSVLTGDGTTTSVTGTWVCTTPSPAPDGATTTFTLTDAYIPGTTQVWLNGLHQRPGYEYNESNPNAKQITFVAAPLGGDQLWVCYYSSGA